VKHGFDEAAADAAESAARRALARQRAVAMLFVDCEGKAGARRS
jgi:hypothetical protein